MITIDKKYILEYIKDMLNSYKIKEINFKEETYHHNSSYKNGTSIIKNGLLSLNELNKKGIISLRKEELNLLNDHYSHVNGIYGISLSKVGLTDLYRDEEEYNPFRNDVIDIIISNEVKAPRSSIHYGNEFIADSIIENKYFKSIDIRLFDFIENIKYEKDKLKLIENYNYLLDIAKTIKEEKLNISIREMSNTNLTLDIDKLSNSKKLII